MLNLKSENDQLMMENTQLRSKLALSNQDLKIMNLKIARIQENRDQLETQLSLTKLENEQLKERIFELKQRSEVDTPILRQRRVHFKEEESSSSFEKPTKSEFSTNINEEQESFFESGTDFDSKWHKNLSISKSHPNYIVLKNNSINQSQCLDDFLFFRTVDGSMTVTGVPFPLGIVMPPLSTFTIHSNHQNAKEVQSESCILFGYKTFGAGKVTENLIMDENGKETANYIFCAFRE
uniref:Uncharacterized protein n=1 Tax=Caenorhabditis tropicalis TaxID=1561998 RepID=A0A1I7UU91_9PELO